MKIGGSWNQKHGFRRVRFPSTTKRSDANKPDPCHKHKPCLFILRISILVVSETGINSIYLNYFILLTSLFIYNEITDNGLIQM